MLRKNKLFVVIAIIVALGSIQLSSQGCESGEMTILKSFVIDYEVNGTPMQCVVEAELCAHCSATGPQSTYVKINSIENASCPGLSDTELYQKVGEQIAENIFEICQVAPCDQNPSARQYVKIPVCVEKVDVGSGCDIVACDWTAYCEMEFLTCYDNQINDWRTTYYGVSLIGVPNCNVIINPNCPSNECFQIGCPTQ